MQQKLEDVVTVSNSLMKNIYNHGFGELNMKCTTLKDGTVKIELLCGLSYVFFIKKEFYREEVI